MHRARMDGFWLLDHYRFTTEQFRSSAEVDSALFPLGRMIITCGGRNHRGAKPMSHADVVISNVTYEVSRVFSGSRSMKDLPMSQIKE